MDIICAKCGKHFSSVEAAREHSGHCRETSQGEPIHWIPAPKSKITPEEWENLMKLINPQHVSPTITPADMEPTAAESTSSEDSATSGTTTPSTSTVDNKRSPDEHKAGKVISKHRSKKTVNYRIQNWLVALLFIFALSFVGLGISVFVGVFIPFWLLFGFSLIFSIEKWFHYPTRKHKSIGKLYRLFLNLSTLSLLGFIIWFAIRLFSRQYIHSALADSLIFLAEIIFLIWMCRVVSKNSWRWPSMKLTALPLIVISLIFAFAGVQPMSLYKDNLVNKWNSYQAAQEAEKAKELAEAIAMTPVLIKEAPSQTETESAPTITQTLMAEEAEREAFELINALREEAGVPSTKWSNELYKLSKRHTQEMADRGELFHTPMEANHGENAWGGTGYHHYQYEELAKVIVRSWMSSPLHKAWLLHAPIRESVVSIVVIPDGQYASWSFWTSNLTRGPALVEEVAREWRNSGSDKPWIDWLISEGYLKP